MRPDAMMWAEIAVEAAPEEHEFLGDLFLSVAGCAGYATEGRNVVGYLPVDDRLEGALLRLREAVERPLSIRRRLAEEDWAHAWKQYFKPQRIGDRFVVKPSWEDYAPSEGQVVIEIDPGMAFGTGLHATTRLCLRAIESRMAPGALVSDVGTGSGILGIGAALMGAERVHARDIDPLAVGVARANVAMNAVGDRMVVDEGATPPAGEHDLVLANILPDVLLGMADALVDSVRPGGHLVLGGIVEPRLADVRAGFAALGLEILDCPVEGEWAAVIARKAV
ncbi:MAG: 50S ribosomal protein L11 methyltransferase [Armatimonadota bacterium]